MLLHAAGDHCRQFRCCSFANAAADAAINLSSIADADAVTVDRSTAVAAVAAVTDVVAVIAVVLIWNLEHENYDESINRRSGSFFCCCCQQSEKNRSSAPLKNRVDRAYSTIITALVACFSVCP